MKPTRNGGLNNMKIGIGWIGMNEVINRWQCGASFRPFSQTIINFTSQWSIFIRKFLVFYSFISIFHLLLLSSVFVFECDNHHKSCCLSGRRRARRHRFACITAQWFTVFFCFFSFGSGFGVNIWSKTGHWTSAIFFFAWSTFRGWMELQPAVNRWFSHHRHKICSFLIYCVEHEFDVTILLFAVLVGCVLGKATVPSAHWRVAHIVTIPSMINECAHWIKYRWVTQNRPFLNENKSRKCDQSVAKKSAHSKQSSMWTSKKKTCWNSQPFQNICVRRSNLNKLNDSCSFN